MKYISGCWWTLLFCAASLLGTFLTWKAEIKTTKNNGERR
jgi:hypothetical protein